MSIAQTLPSPLECNVSACNHYCDPYLLYGAVHTWCMVLSAGVHVGGHMGGYYNRLEHLRLERPSEEHLILTLGHKLRYWQELPARPSAAHHVHIGGRLCPAATD